MNAWAFLGSAAVTVWLHAHMVSAFPLPWPHFNEMIVTHDILQDVTFSVSGFRRVGADIAWVQLLQYVGNDEAFDEHETAPQGRFTEVKSRTLRVTRIDPFFRSAYLFGAGILAWSPGVNRPEEALEVLREGIRYNPDYWIFHTYVAAILFKKHQKTDDMTALLERSIQEPDCPTMVKSILANYYKSEKHYADALRIWRLILDNPRDASYHDTARWRIAEIERVTSSGSVFAH